MIENSVQYKIDNLGDVKSKLKIGGSDKDKFVPNLNVSFFSDEFYFNLNRRDKVVTNQTASLNSGKVTQKIDTETDEYYIDADGHFKWDIVFDAKPSKMDIVWEIEHTEGIEFFYQPRLTPEEIADGCIRPENVIGSYAVYCNKTNNKYKTGKLCHIYRPFVIDANNKKEWAVLEIKNKKLTITLPEDFMQTAVYPVRLDPLIGNNAEGGTEGAISTLRILKYNCTMSENGTANSINVFMRYGTSDKDTILFGIYNDNSGVPGTVFDGADTFAVPDVADAWQSHSMAGNLVSGTIYYPAIRYNSGGNSFYHYDTVAGDQSWTSASTFTDDPAVTAATRRISMYIDYTASGGSTYNESISESASISDTPANIATLLATIAESNAITDSLSNIATLLNAIAESANISDTLSALATFVCAITDDTAITDLFTSFMGNILEISESVNVTDSMSSIATLLAQVNESTAATDNFNAVATLLANISEATTITDLISAGNIYLETVNESVTISDLVFIMTAISKYISATMTIKNKLSADMEVRGIVSGELTATGKIKGVLQ